MKQLRTRGPLWVAIVVLLAACDNGPTDPSAPLIPVASLDIISEQRPALPTSLAVAEIADIVAIVKGADGTSLNDRLVSWTSNNPAVASVVPRSHVAASIRATARGTATITATVAGMSRSLDVEIKAGGLAIIHGPLDFAIGDTAQFAYAFTDVNGVPLTDGIAANSVAWQSSDATLASVSASGIVTALAASGAAPANAVAISVTADGLTAAAYVHITPFVAGLPAMVRFVHAAPDLGQLMFRPSRGSPMAVATGDARAQALTSGRFGVGIAGFPSVNGSGFAGVLPPGEEFTIYAVGTSEQQALVALCDAHAPIAPGEALVRVVMGGEYPGAHDYGANYYMYDLYVVAPDEAAHDVPLAWSFLMGNATTYVPRTTGAFDIVLAKLDIDDGATTPELVRFHVTPQPGRATTYVITGRDAASMRVMTVVDP